MENDQTNLLKETKNKELVNTVLTPLKINLPLDNKMAPTNNKDEEDETKTPKLVKIILVLLFSIIVFFLAGVFYYFALKSSFIDVPRESVEKTSLPAKVNPPIINEDIVVTTPIIKEDIVVVPTFVTKVVDYKFPIDENILKNIRSIDGYCDEVSVAQPYKEDAFLCTDSVKNYDPCFANINKDLSIQPDKVVCQTNPLLPEIFIINLTKPLLKTTSPKPINDNWAWFLELEDGTQLSPYITARPTIDGEVAFYGSKIVNGERTVLIGIGSDMLVVA